jgi:hypothetical protein
MANRLVSTNTNAASTAFSITPDDNNDLTKNARAIYVGTPGATGSLVVQMAGDGSQVTFVGIPAGTVLPIQVSRVLATGTTASTILGLN